MLYSLWSILTILGGIAIIIGFFRLLQYVNEQHGCLPAGLLLVVTLSMCSRNDSEQFNSSAVTQTVPLSSLPYTPKANGVKARVQPIIDSPTLTLTPHGYAQRTHSGDSIRFEAGVLLTGFVSGFRFNKYLITLQPQTPNQARLIIHGVLEWRFLRFTFYQQPVLYNQLVELKPL